MTESAVLIGCKVLVVEDDYFIASDTARALRGAGAEVLGPCRTEADARNLLEAEVPTHAVLDLNLDGVGPQFALAHLLKARGVPFMFFTGYDLDVIPPELSDVARLQKPIPIRDVVGSIKLL